MNNSRHLRIWKPHFLLASNKKWNLNWDDGVQTKFKGEKSISHDAKTWNTGDAGYRFWLETSQCQDCGHKTGSKIRKPNRGAGIPTGGAARSIARSGTAKSARPACGQDFCQAETEVESVLWETRSGFCSSNAQLLSLACDTAVQGRCWMGKDSWRRQEWVVLGLEDYEHVGDQGTPNFFFLNYATVRVF